jgi:hypothetical protein
LTEAVVGRNDVTEVERAIGAFEWLLEYAAISDTSRLLVHFDAARMAASIGRDDKAREHLAASLKGQHKVVLARVASDERLRRLAADIKSP